eukprot:Skav206947  [mRNA]  locus=scaffold1304:83381:84340:+ [translate_table: standard]
MVMVSGRRTVHRRQVKTAPAAPALPRFIAEAAAQTPWEELGQKRRQAFQARVPAQDGPVEMPPDLPLVKL